MKKMILSAAILLAAVMPMKANLVKNFEKIKYSETETRYNKRINAEDSISTPIVFSFYDVDRISIQNNNNTLVRVYDSHWNLIESSRQSIDISVPAGRYYIASERKISHKYIIY